MIEQLQQVSGADLEAHGDVSNDLTREEEEVTFENNVSLLLFYYHYFFHRIIIYGDAMLMRNSVC